MRHEGSLRYRGKASAPVNEIALMGVEDTRPELNNERIEQAGELQEWIDGFLLNKEHALNSIDSIGAFWVPLNRKTEWHQELDAINPRDAEAKLDLESLVAKVRTLKSAATEGQKWGIHVESVPLLDSVRDEEQKRKIDETRVYCLKSGLEEIESSLKLLVSLCEAVQRCVQRA